MSILQRFPRNPTDNMTISDKYGNIWRYITETDTWLSMGVISSPPVVTEETDGLITPEIYTKLQKIKTLLQNNYDLTPFKILPGRDAYWYYLKASNKLFKFTPEAENILRIEIDKGRFFNIIYREICPGYKGKKGEKGEKGLAGIPGPPEICYVPIANNNELEFAIYTPAPLTLTGPLPLPNNHIPDISIRIYRLTQLETTQAQKALPNQDQLHHLAIQYHQYDEILKDFQNVRDQLSQQSLGIQVDSLCNLPLSKVLIAIDNFSIAENPDFEILVDPTGKVEPRVLETSDLDIDLIRTQLTIKYDPITNIVCGSIILKSGVFDDLWCVKSRQKGPDGIQGESGDCYIRIVECTVDNTNIVATCPIINTRLDCDQSIIYTLCSDLLTEICANQIVLLPNSATLTNTTALKSTYAAAQMTLESCKSINRYQFNLLEDSIPELDLEHWEPQSGCVTQRNYDRFKFDWISKTNIEACSDVATWFSPTDVRAGLYPWSLQLPGAPTEPDNCCQTPAFFCPNIQEGGCVGGGTGGPSPSILASGAASRIHEMKIQSNNKINSVIRGAKEWQVRV